jgi:hypothetical protein|tara:strand:- start:1095 stop:1775 length:681 start_codon:yes stop_codon:yes gene_type:complete
MSFLEQVYPELTTQGYSIIENFLPNVSTVKAEVLNLLKNTQDDSTYKFGKALRLGAISENYSNSPNMAKVLDQEWMFSLAKKYLNRDKLFTEIFVTNDYRNDQGLEANGILHFDKFHTLKYMLYLEDCNKSNGAFSVVPESHIDGKFLREKAWQQTEVYQDIKNKPLNDYGEDFGYSEESVVALEGKAGTLIVFDTDTFHRGGVVEDGKERLLIRSHFHDGSRWKR